MNKSAAAIFAVSLLIVSLHIRADTVNVKKILASRYAGMEEAARKKDIHNYTAFMTPDYTANKSTAA